MLFSRSIVSCGGLLACSLVGFPCASAQGQLAALPESYDLRNIDGHSYIGPVHNQGNAGVCYAFASVAVAESAYNLANGLYDENTADFAESFIAWSMDPYYDNLNGTYGSAYSFDELQALVDYGVCSEEDFPYVETDPGVDNHHMDAPRVQFSSWNHLPAYDVETMKYAISKFGAIEVGLAVDDSFANFEGGVYTNDHTMVYSMQDYDDTMNHAVALVGWDDNPDDGDEGVWILRNSWSDEWCEDGYIRIGYYSSMISTTAHYLVYKDWSEYGFEDSNTVIDSDVIGVASESGVMTTCNGVYEWAGDNASVTNNATVIGSISYPTANSIARGIFFWGGSDATLVNNGYVLTMVDNGAGMTVAYGICMQGHSLVNNGNVMTSISESVDEQSANGIWFTAFDSTGYFENTGTVYAYAGEDGGLATGVYVLEAASISNSGNIYALGGTSAYGLRATFFGEAENSGNIAAASRLGESVGVQVNGGRFTNTEEGSIVSDTISGGTDSHAFGIWAVDAEIVNSGTIEATALDGGTSVGVYMTESSLVNAFGGTISATTISDSSDPAYVDTTSIGIDATDSTVVNNGSIVGATSTLTNSTLSGTGSFTGNVIVTDSTISPGSSVGTLTIDGDFTSSGTLTMNIEVGNGSYDRLVVSGLATIGGTGTLNIIPLGYMAAGDYAFIVSDGTSGAFDTVNGLPVLFSGSVEATDSGFVLDLLRKSYSEFCAYPELEAMGAALDEVRVAAGGNLATMLNNIDAYETAAQIQSAMNDLSPSMNATASRAALENINRADEYILGRRKAIESTLGKGSAWFGMLSREEHRQAFGSFDAYSEDASGIVAGADCRIGEHFAIGFAAASTSQELDVTGSIDNADIDAKRGYLYATWDQKPGMDGLYVASAVGFGTSKIKSNRYVAFLDSVLGSSHDAKDYSFSISTGYDLNNDFWTTRPFATLKYASLHEDAYSETGNVAALDFDKRTSDSLQTALGMSVSAHFVKGKYVFIPEVCVQKAFELNSDAEDLDARFSVGPTFGAAGRDMSDDATSASCALRVLWGSRVMFTARYERTEYDSDDDYSDSISANLQVWF